MNEPPQFSGIRTLAGLRERGQEIDAAYHRHMRMRTRTFREAGFPPPPVAGTDGIIPLTDPGQLVEEGRQQHNCVGGYAERVTAGEVFVYCVLLPERATLSIRPAADGGWEIAQLLRACNQPVSAATAVTVQLWLARESVSI